VRDLAIISIKKSILFAERIEFLRYIILLTRLKVTILKVKKILD
jgi:hypothetical protein